MMQPKTTQNNPNKQTKIAQYIYLGPFCIYVFDILFDHLKLLDIQYDNYINLWSWALLQESHIFLEVVENYLPWETLSFLRKSSE